MRVAYRVRADDGFTDICELPEFKGLTSGLGIAWICGGIAEFRVESCSVTVIDDNTGRPHILPGSLKGGTPARFIRIWQSKKTQSVTIIGRFEGEPVSITAVMDKRVLQVFYPRALDGKITPLESMISHAVRKHFTLFEYQSRQDMGSKFLDTYTCSVFTDQIHGLLILATSIQNPECTVRWYTHHEEGVRKDDLRYGLHSDRKKQSVAEFVDEYEWLTLTSSVVALSWKGYQIFIRCNYKTKTVDILWDKWLNNELGPFIQWLNTALYETAFGAASTIQEKTI